MYFSVSIFLPSSSSSSLSLMSAAKELYQSLFCLSTTNLRCAIIAVLDEEMAPRVLLPTPGPGPQIRRATVDTTKSSVPALTTTDPATRAGDPFLAAARRRGCSLCFGGYVTMTAEEDGQERHEAVPCKCRTQERR
jgi:hypothetical protein